MLANGDVIYYQQGYYQLDFQAFFTLATNRERVFTTSHGREYFLAHHARHLAEFQHYFGDAYDFSVRSLGTIDGACRRLVKSGVSEADLFLPLVCYVAEVLIQQTGGQWSHDADRPDVTTITGRDGRPYDPYFCIRKILINQHKPHAIEAAITAQFA
ncbi:hypothetical protein [Hymenobacter aerophilus]|uniref:hypothetical protein n=1 Tax=Hymenobacter aerophilus TaxID=119644 RepID=UPI00037705FD|nr:hypothetical protein [Hymenobacter aerophilus]